MKIGSITLSNPVALAPMAGVTDLPFRQLCRRLGAGYVVGEMVASDPSLRGSRKTRLRGVHLEEPEPRAIQIVGWDPAVMADAARFNVDQGASIIDINMGCPAKKVCRRDAGSALLADEPLVANILEAVVAAVDVPVTLKIRTGVSPTRRNAVRVAAIAEQSGIAALAVHGRTRACKYRGVAEYETIRAVVDAISIPVFANGDVVNADQAALVLEQTRAAGIMLGRGAHGRPWLPGQIAHWLRSGQRVPDPSILEQRAIVLEHLDAIHSFYGDQQGVRVARKHIKWYLGQADPDASGSRECLVEEDLIRQRGLVSDWYLRLAEKSDVEKIWSGRTGPIGPMDRHQRFNGITNL